MQYRRLIAIATLAGIVTVSHAHAQVTLTIDPNVEYQTITGIGGGDLEIGTLADAQHAVNELGASTYRLLYDFDLFGFEPANDNADPFTFNWPAFDKSALADAISFLRHMKAAGMKHFFYSVLAVPRWMKVNVTEPQSSVAFWCRGQCGGFIDTTKYEEYAECVTAWVSVLKDSVLELDAISIQNEPAFEEPYGSCVFTPVQMRDAAKATARHFRAAGIKTKIVVGEDVIGGQNAKSYIGIAGIDTALRPSLVAGAVHNYAGDGITASSPAAVAWRSTYNATSRFGLEHWMTETSGFANSWPGAMSAASVMYGAFKYGKLNLWAWLENPKAANADMCAITKNFSKYVRPGAVQIESATSDTTVMPLTFRDRNTNRLITIIINRSPAERTLALAGSAIPAQVQMYRSSATDRFVDAGLVQSNAVTIASNSVTTLVGANYTPTVAVSKPAPQHDVRHIATGTRTALYRLDGRRVCATTGKLTGGAQNASVYVATRTVGGVKATRRVVELNAR